MNPVYNRVILHVVYWHDKETAVNLQSGEKVPTLALCKFIKNQIDPSSRCLPNSWHLPCYNTVHRWNTGVVGEILDVAGADAAKRAPAAEVKRHAVRNR